MPIPFEVFTLVANTLIGGFLNLSANAREDRREEFSQMMQASTAQANIYKDAREFRGGWGFSWTRRVIAIMAVLSIIVLPKVAMIIFPDLSIAYASRIFQWANFETLPATSWDWGTGIILITPLDTHLMSAIVGLFFGSEITKRK